MELALPSDLTREELAKFLPTLRAIRAFELLLAQVNTAIPEEITAIISNLEQINAKLDVLVVAPRKEVCALLSPGFGVEPRSELGTLSYQNAEKAAITGGAITAAITDSTTNLIASSLTLTNGSGASVGTLTNAPSAGNPSKWVLINDNGTTRYVPAW
jgi:hypothetical protein